MSKFAARTAADTARLVEASPLAWVVSGVGENFRATLLPIRAVTDDKGGVARLTGHFARRNDQVTLLSVDPRATILFLGPHGYVSPSWMADRTQAPTWNYASAQFLVEIEFFDDPPRVRAHLDDLVQAMEGDRANAWTVDETAQRYAALSRNIAGFDARIIETREKFKLGQDERPDVFADIMSGLERTGQRDLHDWMAVFAAEK
ncbi:MAG: FMN-binding negative transcriptional regulator [Gammaproteobacteria bacterium]